jgi:hypothetical protein
MENSVVIPQKKKNRSTIWSSNSTSEYKCKRIESKDFNRYLHTHVHSSIIHNSQKAEAALVSIHGRLDKRIHTMEYYPTLKMKEIGCRWSLRTLS